MHPSIAERREVIAELCRRYGVRRLEVFGSGARGSDFDVERSDADFLVEYGPAGRLGPLEEFFGLRDALAALLGRRVDLVELTAIRNPYVLKEINSAREVVYAS